MNIMLTVKIKYITLTSFCMCQGEKRKKMTELRSCTWKRLLVLYTSRRKQLKTIICTNKILDYVQWKKF